jgi:hypothetical protein
VGDVALKAVSGQLSAVSFRLWRLLFQFLVAFLEGLQQVRFHALQFLSKPAFVFGRKAYD